MELHPGLPEAHRALGFYDYWGLREYDRALEQFAIAAEALPNDVGPLVGMCGIFRRLGRWDEALEVYKTRQRFDPQDYGQRARPTSRDDRNVRSPEP